MGNKLFERVVNCCSVQRRSKNGLNTARAFLHTHSVQVGIHTPDTLCVSDQTQSMVSHESSDSLAGAQHTGREGPLRQQQEGINGRGWACSNPADEAPNRRG